MDESNLVHHLNCPICLQIPEKEIYQCKNGHILCSHCFGKVSICPQCRERYGGTSIRCRALESLLDSMKLSCHNEGKGCKEKFTRSDIREHMSNCAYGIARAVAIHPKQIRDGPLRQSVLLFSVSLGREYCSQHKYQHWRCRQLPQSYDSVKTIGKYQPEANASCGCEVNTVKIPLGKTKENDEFPSYEADYNEYIIFDVSRATLRYAVDVEFALCEGVDEEEEDDATT